VARNTVVVVGGGFAGIETVAEMPLHAYSQPKYLTCLDLRPWGAVYTEGWDRQVHLQQQEAKELKRAINTQWIYLPEHHREAIFGIANPEHVIVP